jgi:hypothetical protein
MRFIGAKKVRHGILRRNQSMTPEKRLAGRSLAKVVVGACEIVIRREIEMRSKDRAALVKLIVQLPAKQLNFPISLTRNDFRNESQVHFSRTLLTRLERRVYGDVLHVLFYVKLLRAAVNLRVALLNKCCGVPVKPVDQTLLRMIHCAREQSVVVVRNLENVSTLANCQCNDVVANIVDRYTAFLGSIHMISGICTITYKANLLSGSRRIHA